MSNSKWNNWQRINLQNMQATHSAQYQKEKKKKRERERDMKKKKKKQNKTIKNWAEELNRHLSKEDIQMASKHIKRHSTLLIIVDVQLLSHVKLFVTPWTATCQASLSFTISQSLLKFMSTESVMPSNHLILCHPLLLLPSTFPSTRVFSKELVQISWPNIGALVSASVLLMNSQDWFPSWLTDWISLQSKGLSGVFSNFSNWCPKAPILQCSAFFIVQLSHLYRTTGEIIAWTIWTFVGKVMSRLVTAFLARASIF